MNHSGKPVVDISEQLKTSPSSVTNQANSHSLLRNELTRLLLIKIQNIMRHEASKKADRSKEQITYGQWLYSILSVDDYFLQAIAQLQARAQSQEKTEAETFEELLKLTEAYKLAWAALLDAMIVHNNIDHLRRSEINARLEGLGLAPISDVEQEMNFIGNWLQRTLNSMAGAGTWETIGRQNQFVHHAGILQYPSIAQSAAYLLHRNALGEAAGMPLPTQHLKLVWHTPRVADPIILTPRQKIDMFLLNAMAFLGSDSPHTLTFFISEEELRALQDHYMDDLVYFFTKLEQLRLQTLVLPGLSKELADELQAAVANAAAPLEFAFLVQNSLGPITLTEIHQPDPSLDGRRAELIRFTRTQAPVEFLKDLTAASAKLKRQILREMYPCAGGAPEPAYHAAWQVLCLAGREDKLPFVEGTGNHAKMRDLSKNPVIMIDITQEQLESIVQEWNKAHPGNGDSAEDILEKWALEISENDTDLGREDFKSIQHNFTGISTPETQLSLAHISVSPYDRMATYINTVDPQTGMPAEQYYYGDTALAPLEIRKGKALPQKRYPLHYVSHRYESTIGVNGANGFDSFEGGEHNVWHHEQIRNAHWDRIKQQAIADAEQFAKTGMFTPQIGYQSPIGLAGANDLSSFLLSKQVSYDVGLTGEAPQRLYANQPTAGYQPIYSDKARVPYVQGYQHARTAVTEEIKYAVWKKTTALQVTADQLFALLQTQQLHHLLCDSTDPDQKQMRSGIEYIDEHKLVKVTAWKTVSANDYWNYLYRLNQLILPSLQSSLQKQATDLTVNRSKFNKDPVVAEYLSLAPGQQPQNISNFRVTTASEVSKKLRQKLEKFGKAYQNNTPLHTLSKEDQLDLRHISVTVHVIEKSKIKPSGIINDYDIKSQHFDLEHNHPDELLSLYAGSHPTLQLVYKRDSFNRSLSFQSGFSEIVEGSGWVPDRITYTTYEIPEKLSIVVPEAGEESVKAITRYDVDAKGVEPAGSVTVPAQAVHVTPYVHTKRFSYVFRVKPTEGQPIPNLQSKDVAFEAFLHNNPHAKLGNRIVAVVYSDAQMDWLLENYRDELYLEATFNLGEKLDQFDADINKAHPAMTAGTNERNEHYHIHTETPALLPAFPTAAECSLNQGAQMALEMGGNALSLLKTIAYQTADRCSYDFLLRAANLARQSAGNPIRNILNATTRLPSLLAGSKQLSAEYYSEHHFGSLHEHLGNMPADYLANILLETSRSHHPSILDISAYAHIDGLEEALLGDLQYHVGAALSLLAAAEVTTIITKTPELATKLNELLRGQGIHMIAIEKVSGAPRFAVPMHNTTRDSLQNMMEQKISYPVADATAEFHARIVDRVKAGLLVGFTRGASTTDASHQEKVFSWIYSLQNRYHETEAKALLEAFSNALHMMPPIVLDEKWVSRQVELLIETERHSKGYLRNIRQRLANYIQGPRYFETEEDWLRDALGQYLYSYQSDRRVDPVFLTDGLPRDPQSMIRSAGYHTAFFDPTYYIAWKMPELFHDAAHTVLHQILAYELEPSVAYNGDFRPGIHKEFAQFCAAPEIALRAFFETATYHQWESNLAYVFTDILRRYAVLDTAEKKEYFLDTLTNGSEDNIQELLKQSQKDFLEQTRLRTNKYYALAASACFDMFSTFMQMTAAQLRKQESPDFMEQQHHAIQTFQRIIASPNLADRFFSIKRENQLFQKIAEAVGPFRQPISPADEADAEGAVVKADMEISTSFDSQTEATLQADAEKDQDQNLQENLDEDAEKILEQFALLDCDEQKNYYTLYTIDPKTKRLTYRCYPVKNLATEVGASLRGLTAKIANNEAVSAAFSQTPKVFALDTSDVIVERLLTTELRHVTVSGSLALLPHQKVDLAAFEYSLTPSGKIHSYNRPFSYHPIIADSLLQWVSGHDYSEYLATQEMIRCTQGASQNPLSMQNILKTISEHVMSLEPEYSVQDNVGLDPILKSVVDGDHGAPRKINLYVQSQKFLAYTTPTFEKKRLMSDLILSKSDAASQERMKKQLQTLGTLIQHQSLNVAQNSDPSCFNWTDWLFAMDATQAYGRNHLPTNLVSIFQDKYSFQDFILTIARNHDYKETLHVFWNIAAQIFDLASENGPASHAKARMMFEWMIAHITAKKDSSLHLEEYWTQVFKRLDTPDCKERILIYDMVTSSETYHSQTFHGAYNRWHKVYADDVYAKTGDYPSQRFKRNAKQKFAATGTLDGISSERIYTESKAKEFYAEQMDVPGLQTQLEQKVSSFIEYMQNQVGHARPLSAFLCNAVQKQFDLNISILDSVPTPSLIPTEASSVLHSYQVLAHTALTPTDFPETHTVPLTHLIYAGRSCHENLTLTVKARLDLSALERSVNRLSHEYCLDKVMVFNPQIQAPQKATDFLLSLWTTKEIKAYTDCSVEDTDKMISEYESQQILRHIIENKIVPTLDHAGLTRDARESLQDEILSEDLGCSTIAVTKLFDQYRRFRAQFKSCTGVSLINNSHTNAFLEFVIDDALTNAETQEKMSSDRSAALETEIGLEPVDPGSTASEPEKIHYAYDLEAYNRRREFYTQHPDAMIGDFDPKNYRLGFTASILSLYETYFPAILNNPKKAKQSAVFLYQIMTLVMRSGLYKEGFEYLREEFLASLQGLFGRYSEKNRPVDRPNTQKSFESLSFWGLEPHRESIEVVANLANLAGQGDLVNAADTYLTRGKDFIHQQGEQFLDAITETMLENNGAQPGGPKPPAANGVKKADPTLSLDEKRLEGAVGDLLNGFIDFNEQYPDIDEEGLSLFVNTTAIFDELSAAYPMMPTEYRGSLTRAQHKEKLNYLRYVIFKTSTSQKPAQTEETEALLGTLKQYAAAAHRLSILLGEPLDRLSPQGQAALKKESRDLEARLANMGSMLETIDLSHKIDLQMDTFHRSAALMQENMHHKISMLGKFMACFTQKKGVMVFDAGLYTKYYLDGKVSPTKAEAAPSRKDLHASYSTDSLDSDNSPKSADDKVSAMDPRLLKGTSGLKEMSRLYIEKSLAAEHKPYTENPEHYPPGVDPVTHASKREAIIMGMRFVEADDTPEAVEEETLVKNLLLRMTADIERTLIGTPSAVDPNVRENSGMVFNTRTELPSSFAEFQGLSPVDMDRAQLAKFFHACRVYFKEVRLREGRIDLVRHYDLIVNLIACVSCTLASLPGFGFFPNTLQIATSILSVIYPRVFLEVATGQGKTAISAMQNILQYFLGLNSEYITSSADLARQTGGQLRLPLQALNVETASVNHTNLETPYSSEAIAVASLEDMMLSYLVLDKKEWENPEMRNVCADEVDFLTFSQSAFKSQIPDKHTVFNDIKFPGEEGRKQLEHFMLALLMFYKVPRHTLNNDFPDDNDTWGHCNVSRTFEDVADRMHAEFGSRFSAFLEHSNLPDELQTNAKMVFAEVKQYSAFWHELLYGVHSLQAVIAQGKKESREKDAEGKFISRPGEGTVFALVQDYSHNRKFARPMKDGNILHASQFSLAMQQLLHVYCNYFTVDDTPISTTNVESADVCYVDYLSSILAAHSMHSCFKAVLECGHFFGATGTLGSPKEVRQLKAIAKGARFISMPSAQPRTVVVASYKAADATEISAEKGKWLFEDTQRQQIDKTSDAILKLVDDPAKYAPEDMDYVLDPESPVLVLTSNNEKLRQALYKKAISRPGVNAEDIHYYSTTSDVEGEEALSFEAAKNAAARPNARMYSTSGLLSRGADIKVAEEARERSSRNKEAYANATTGVNRELLEAFHADPKDDTLAADVVAECQNAAPGLTVEELRKLHTKAFKEKYVLVVVVTPDFDHTKRRELLQSIGRTDRNGGGGLAFIYEVVKDHKIQYGPESIPDHFRGSSTLTQRAAYRTYTELHEDPILGFNSIHEGLQLATQNAGKEPSLDPADWFGGTIQHWKHSIASGAQALKESLPNGAPGMWSACSNFFRGSDQDRVKRLGMIRAKMTEILRVSFSLLLKVPKSEVEEREHVMSSIVYKQSGFVLDTTESDDSHAPIPATRDTLRELLARSEHRANTPVAKPDPNRIIDSRLELGIVTHPLFPRDRLVQHCINQGLVQSEAHFYTKVRFLEGPISNAQKANFQQLIDITEDGRQASPVDVASLYRHLSAFWKTMDLQGVPAKLTYSPYKVNPFKKDGRVDTNLLQNTESVAAYLSVRDIFTTPGAFPTALAEMKANMSAKEARQGYLSSYKALSSMKSSYDFVAPNQSSIAFDFNPLIRDIGTDLTEFALSELSVEEAWAGVASMYNTVRPFAQILREKYHITKGKDPASIAPLKPMPTHFHDPHSLYAHPDFSLDGSITTSLSDRIAFSQARQFLQLWEKNPESCTTVMTIAEGLFERTRGNVQKFHLDSDDPNQTQTHTALVEKLCSHESMQDLADIYYKAMVKTSRRQHLLTFVGSVPMWQSEATRLMENIDRIRTKDEDLYQNMMRLYGEIQTITQQADILQYRIVDLDWDTQLADAQEDEDEDLVHEISEKIAADKDKNYQNALQTAQEEYIKVRNALERAQIKYAALEKSRADLGYEKIQEWVAETRQSIQIDPDTDPNALVNALLSNLLSRQLYDRKKHNELAVLEEHKIKMDDFVPVEVLNRMPNWIDTPVDELFAPVYTEIPNDIIALDVITFIAEYDRLSLTDEDESEALMAFKALFARHAMNASRSPLFSKELRKEMPESYRRVIESFLKRTNYANRSRTVIDRIKEEIRRPVSESAKKANVPELEPSYKLAQCLSLPAEDFEETAGLYMDEPMPSVAQIASAYWLQQIEIRRYTVGHSVMRNTHRLEPQDARAFGKIAFSAITVLAAAYLFWPLCLMLTLGMTLPAAMIFSAATLSTIILGIRMLEANFAPLLPWLGQGLYIAPQYIMTVGGYLVNNLTLAYSMVHLSVYTDKTKSTDSTTSWIAAALADLPKMRFRQWLQDEINTVNQKKEALALGVEPTKEAASKKAWSFGLNRISQALAQDHVLLNFLTKLTTQLVLVLVQFVILMPLYYGIPLVRNLPNIARHIYSQFGAKKSGSFLQAHVRAKIKPAAPLFEHPAPSLATFLKVNQTTAAPKTQLGKCLDWLIDQTETAVDSEGNVIAPAKLKETLQAASSLVGLLGTNSSSSGLLGSLASQLNMGAEMADKALSGERGASIRNALVFLNKDKKPVMAEEDKDIIASSLSAVSEMYENNTSAKVTVAALRSLLGIEEGYAVDVSDSIVKPNIEVPLGSHLQRALNPAVKMVSNLLTRNIF